MLLHEGSTWLLAIAMWLAVVSCGAPVDAARPEASSVVASCALPAEPAVLRRDGRAILEVWTVEHDALLFAPGAPADDDLDGFRRAIRRAGAEIARPPVAPPIVGASERELWRREAHNAELVYSGRGGSVRPASCLESILFGRQHRRFSQLTRPTEFVASILRKRVDGRDLLRIYLGASDQMFPPKAFYAIDLVERDVEAGWQLDSVLHNHTVRRHGDRLLLGTPAPSTSDVQLMRGLAEDLGLREVLVTNGVFTGVVPASALPLFETRD